ncbi:carbohydrate ABC transporter permease [Rhodothermus bifroesti]|uniref:Sugar ABC transporter permease n=1 Tax=Rhodothermus marinus TaxID=29549 RepID=A0A7V2F682_RHOMR|nr:sugar ABC transporter permease [Rhodothermus bifroesti]GBD02111.1 Lactose transport system permease protein LacF [bacterium HR18]
MKRSWTELRAATWFLAPALAVVLLFLFLPALAAWMLSLTDFDLYTFAEPAALRWVGLRNYLALLQDGRFWKALQNTLIFVGLGGLLTLCLALGAALWIHQRFVRWKAFWRMVYFAPVVTSLVAVAIVWRYLLHARYGLANQALAWLGLPPIDWLGDPQWALPALILMAVWKNYGYDLLIFLAALQAIPEELYDAARMDGASVWQQLRYVTLPALRPMIALAGLITANGYLQVFAEPYVMTQGGPLDATLTLVLLLYEQGFRWWRLGYAAALAFVLFVLMLGLSWMLWRQHRS